jgi:hypothetical protein
MMKKVLICFGSVEYQFSIERLLSSAKDYFDELIIYRENDIDINFYNQNIEIFKHRRGLGYWLWKPYFISKTLQGLSEGDFCFYLDATCVFKASPNILFDECNRNKGILLFDNSGQINSTWTKMDCFNLMQLTDQKYLKGKQADAAMQLYENNPLSRTFINDVLSFSKNYNIISDAPNITGQNCSDFKDHRHDQSILSLLAIKYGVKLAKSPRREGNYFIDGHHSIIELKRDVVKNSAPPKFEINQSMKKLYGFISTMIVREVVSATKFNEINIHLFQVYIFLGIIKSFYGNFSIAQKLLKKLVTDIERFDEVDPARLVLLHDLFNNNQDLLKVIIQDVKKSRPSRLWFKDWIESCENFFLNNGRTEEAFNLIFKIGLEQFRIPYSELPLIIEFFIKVLQLDESELNNCSSDRT